MVPSGGYICGAGSSCGSALFGAEVERGVFSPAALVSWAGASSMSTSSSALVRVSWRASASARLDLWGIFRIIRSLGAGIRRAVKLKKHLLLRGGGLKLYSLSRLASCQPHSWEWERLHTHQPHIHGTKLET